MKNPSSGPATSADKTSIAKGTRTVFAETEKECKKDVVVLECKNNGKECESSGAVRM